MPTRLYLTNTAATFTPQTDTYTYIDKVDREAVRTKGTTSFATRNVFSSAPPANSKHLAGLFRWRLGAQTITGTVASVIRMCQQYNTTGYRSYCRLSVQSSDYSVVRGVLIAGTTGEVLSANEVLRNTRVFNNLTATSVTSQDGDWLVLEVGAIADGTTPFTSFVQFEYGENAADLTFDSTGTTQGAPWLEFSQTLLAQGETIPSNTAAELLNYRRSSLKAVI